MKCDAVKETKKNDELQYDLLLVRKCKSEQNKNVLS